MRTVTAVLTALCCLTILAAIMPQVAKANIVLLREDVSWTTEGDIVRFSLRFRNPGPETSQPGMTEMYAQPFGVFLPNEVLIGASDLPPMAVDSFFDVFYEVSISQLPPSAEESTPGGGGRQECGPDDHWDGNVDINWYSGGEVGSVNYHFGTLQVCPTAGYSYIHVIDLCGTLSTWSFSGVCSGWSVALVEEDLFTPSPASLPSNWTGYARVSANGSVNVGDTCNISLTIVCDGIPATINLMSEACDCGIIPVEPNTWSSVKSLYN